MAGFGELLTLSACRLGVLTPIMPKVYGRTLVDRTIVEDSASHRCL